MKKIINAKYNECDKNDNYLFGNIESAYTATKRYIKENDKPILPIIGEFHFCRYFKEFWEIELLKIKAQGLDGVAVYIFWNHHEEKKGVFNFEKDNNIKEFLSLCKKHSIKVVLRIGPWCHGEVRNGGFPDWLKFIKKRGDYSKYLNYVKHYWTALFEETKEYYDGKTVIGIQLENEYGGKLKHIVTLRKLAENIGFKTPFFTMTAWPTNTPDKRFLPMMGGYPEAPWTQNKKPLKNANRFALVSGRTEAEIGEDLIKIKRDKADFSEFPYVGCEVGTGNQVTQHRRPIISEKDGYGIAFAKFASGMNWMGYYMYHGGRNPRGKLLQESRLTLYPNNYPIIDYDFQAPISKDGKVRNSGNLLRLMHYFIKFYDNEVAKTTTAFTTDSGLPYVSTRFHKNNNGYIFVSNYERGEITKDIEVDFDLIIETYKIKLPKLKVKKDTNFFFPYNFYIKETKVDYITAQPIIKKDKVQYFQKIEGVVPKICIDGKEIEIKEKLTIEGVDIIVLDRNSSYKFYYLDGKTIFSDGEVYVLDNKIFAELISGGSLSIDGKKTNTDRRIIDKGIYLKECGRKKLPHNYYLYSRGKKSYYKLTIDKKIITENFDVKIIFDFVGLNLQVFHKDVLIDDYFNTDGKYVFHLKTFKDLLKTDNTLIIKVAAATSWGVGNVYNEINMPIGEIALKIKEIISYCLLQI